MEPDRFRFDRFVLDPANRLLTCDSGPVEVNGRYLDALALLVRDAGKLVTKDRFLDEVWRGVPVTDEALTQCIKTLRRALGDSAANPRLIETVPKHGYRFIAPVETCQGEPQTEEVATPKATYDARQALLFAAAGTIGGGIAGVLLGLLYGFASASQPNEPGVGAVSLLLVLVSLAIIAALIGAVGISLGVAAAGLAPNRRWPWSVAGGAIGGLVVGAFAKLLGVDAFNLMLGRSPGDITGAGEGALLGAAIGLAAGFGQRGGEPRSMVRSIAAAGFAGAVVGAVIPLTGGRMFGGSLDLLARSFPDSRLSLDEIGGLFGEPGFGPFSQTVSGAFEGSVFCACIVAAMMVARRQLGDRP